MNDKGLLDTLNINLAEAYKTEAELDKVIKILNGSHQEDKEDMKASVYCISVVTTSLENALIRIREKTDYILKFLSGPEKEILEKKR